MVISRRQMLVNGTIFLGLGRYALSEGEAPVELEFPDVALDPQLRLSAAINTSGYNTCKVQVLGGDGKVVWQSTEWGAEPNRSHSWSTERLGGIDTKTQVVRAVMRPTRSVIPSMAVAVHQGTDVDQAQIEKLAEMARFVADPAHLPTGQAQGPIGGHFEVTLYRDSTVTVHIWRGNVARGTPVYERQSHNVAAGSNPVPWDLRIRGGGLASPGRYIALLTCTPNDKGRAATFLGSSFGVV